MKPILGATIFVLSMAFSYSAFAESLRWAAAGDSLTLDPHAIMEGQTLALAHQIYEPLVKRDMDGKLAPALATSWRIDPQNPTIWTFELRKQVKFQDGCILDAQDVVFSFNRAKMANSGFKEMLASVSAVKIIDEDTIQIETFGPNPILPTNLTNMMIMDEDWAKEHNVTEPQKFAAKEETYAVRNANGTGPYQLVSREPDVKTVLKRHSDYWGKGAFPLEVSEIIYKPIQNNATRVAALLSGEVDFVQDVPVQDIEGIGTQSDLKIASTAENRSIFFGLNQGADDLSSDDVKGKNPLADKRVRKAMNFAIDREAIRKIVMRGHSDPAGMIAPPSVNGWNAVLDKYETNIAQAKQLMDEAGYGNGFSIRMDCPNDRYINDEAICQAVVGMMAKIGVNVNLSAKPKAQFFPMIFKGETDFYLIGWGVPTFDSENIFSFLLHSRQEKLGTLNNTGYANPDLDKKIRLLSSEMDIEKRDEMITDIWKQVSDDIVYLPLHNQVLNWAMKKRISFQVQPENQPHFKYLRFLH